MNRLTDRRILQIILPGFRIQSEILTDFRILKLQRFAVRSIFWVRILDFACQEVRIVDRGSERTSEMRCFWTFFCHGRDSLHVTHQGNSNALWPAGRCDMLPAGRLLCSRSYPWRPWHCMTCIVLVAIGSIGKLWSLALLLSSFPGSFWKIIFGKWSEGWPLT